jgi:HK97 family phage major capsid protein
MNSVLQLALSECDKPGTVGTKPLTAMRERRNLMRSAMEAVLAAPTRENRDLLQSETRDFEHARNRITEIDERIAELEYEGKREASAAEARIGFSEPSGIGGAFTSGGETYHRGATSPSYFADLYNAQRGDADASDRLRRNNREVGMESRALGNTGATGGSGGEFAPPAWIIDQYVKLARPGRVTADLFHKEDLPAGVSSVNIPKIATGTTVAQQTTQNTAVAQTDITSTSLSSGVVTLAGKQVCSQQLLDQGGIRVDEVILEDLAADLARQLGTQALTGSGTGGQLKGFLTATSSNVVTWTQATPTASGFYAQLAKLQGQINATRYKAPDAVVMHPRRWAWFASFTDSTGRPLVVPTSGSFNSMASPTDGMQGAAGHVGSVLGMDVFTDPNLPVGGGAAANQDTVLMFVRDDVWLYESTLRAEAFTSTYADSMGILYRVFAYYAMIPDRYSSSLGQVSGTGLVTPTFAN